jgi:hypothetical protein
MAKAPVKLSPFSRRSLLAAPLAAALVVSVAGAGWAKAHKKKAPGTSASARAASSGGTATHATKATTHKRKGPDVDVSHIKRHKPLKKLRPELAAIIRAENYQHQGYGVVEGDLPAPVRGATCPDAMAIVDARFCIDRYEATLVEVSGEDEIPWSAFDMPVAGKTFRAVTLPGVMPQAYISGAQAEMACENAGKRLCKPVEWRTACMGPKKQTWGYAASRSDNKCNDRGKSPMLHFYPQVNESWTLVGMTEMNDPRLNQMDGSLMKTAANPECTNDYGVYDMVGNLHEWTNDPNGTFQGGYYLDTHQNGDGCGYRTTAHEFTYHDYSTGFRCCADAVEPESTSSESP